jgi:hypothetical protein
MKNGGAAANRHPARHRTQSKPINANQSEEALKSRFGQPLALKRRRRWTVLFASFYVPFGRSFPLRVGAPSGSLHPLI